MRAPPDSAGQTTGGNHDDRATGQSGAPDAIVRRVLSSYRRERGHRRGERRRSVELHGARCLADMTATAVALTRSCSQPSGRPLNGDTAVRSLPARRHRAINGPRSNASEHDAFDAHGQTVRTQRWTSDSRPAPESCLTFAPSRRCRTAYEVLYVATPSVVARKPLTGRRSRAAHAVPFRRPSLAVTTELLPSTRAAFFEPALDVSDGTPTRGHRSTAAVGARRGRMLDLHGRHWLASRGPRSTHERNRLRPALPDYAPVPRSALGPALNEQGYYVGRVERNLYWVTDGTYQSAFLTTLGRRRPVRRAAHDRPQHPAGRRRDRRRQRRQQQGHAPHLLAPPRRPRRRRPRCSTRTSPGSATRRRGGCCCATTTRRGRRTKRRSRTAARLEIGGERIDLAWHGANHSPDNIFIHLPDHDTLMLIDIVNPGWAPVYVSQPDRGHPRLHRGAGERARLLVEALHRRPHRPARAPATT